MADGGPPALQPTPVIPPVVPPAPPVQSNQPASMPQLSWSHFKPEFACKPDKDAEAHLFRTND